ncbi:MAG TPA: lipoyl(octanoyl) transferase LipB [Fimbriimonadaceae bacterium]|nr:lipoyl(octanoyl) transferase LipB [Fimbriimonadaceae bacterium]
MSEREARVCWMGRVSYRDAYQVQLRVAARVKEGGEDTLLFVEHDPVLTLGANFHEDNLLLPVEDYAAAGVDVVDTDRGGDVTYHGPNQLVIYPIFSLYGRGKDLHKWLRDLEETIIRVCAEFGLEAERFPPYTGVWVNGRKVAAIGIKVSRWVSIHGIALNCDNDLAPFDSIIPCGIHDFGVTSLSNEAGRRITIEEARPVVARAFERAFGITLRPISLAELLDEADQADST